MCAFLIMRFELPKGLLVKAQSFKGSKRKQVQRRQNISV